MKKPWGGYAIFYFDEKDKGNHTNFKLDSDGGVLILTDKEGNRLDKVTYPKPFRNTSYGRTTNGGSTFGHFLSASMGQSNTGIATAKSQTQAPTFSQSGGFYSGNQTISISSPNASATIYYTTDGSEPKAEISTRYNAPITINNTTILRAIAVVNGEINSEISTSSYFIGNTIASPIKVVSLATDRDYLFGDELGALAVGTNGSSVPNYCSARENVANYMNDWDRPCNIEVFDENQEQRISQEVKVGAFGACSRTKPIKSIKVKANKVYGTNKFDYALFHEKPNLKWKSFVLRNAGNDFGRMLFRDGYLQTLAASGMDIDHQAYEPAVVFVNGEYYALMGIRERTNKDFIYSNYGLSEGEFCIEESPKKAIECDSYQEVLDIAKDPNASYESIDRLIDVEELLNYFTAEIYYCNQDWSEGNIKAWKRNKDGKWRWILYDTEFSTSIYSDYLNTNGFSYAAKCGFFPLLKNNPVIKKRLLNKFTLHAGTTFAEENVSAILDSMASLIENEADYYFDFLVQQKTNEASSWRNEVEKVRNFITARPDYLFKHVADSLRLGAPAPIHIYADMEGTSYDLNGLDLINKKDFRSYYFKGTELSVKANAPDGYRFKNWEVCKEKHLLSSGSTWKYLYQNNAPESNWKEASYNDGGWKEGAAPLGAGLNYFVKTNITGNTQGGGWGGGFGGFGGWGGFGGAAVNTTSYFRNSFTINNLSSIGDLQCTMKVNDGVIIYINGKEAYRFNMPDLAVMPDTMNAVLDMNSYATHRFTINKNLLTEGKNIIAVELHCAAKSSTLAFDIAIQDANDNVQVVNTSNQPTYTTTFNDSLTLHAIFEKDPTWSPDDVKLYLNEICIANKQYVDEYLEDDDWIEIYNDATSPIDLAGMFLSDKRSNLTRYEIPSGYPEETTIPAKGYIVFWADGDSTTQGPLHTNFQLPKTKEQTVTLSRMVNGEIQVIDSVRYKLHTKGNTFARFSYQGDGAWQLSSRPTFAARNIYAPDHSTPINVGLELAMANGYDVRIYPNPVDDYLWFAFGNEKSATISITDYMGHTLIRQRIESGESIFVGDLEPKVYIVNIQSGQETITTKFVKQ